MILPRKYLNVFEMKLLWKGLLQKGRCGKYEKDREQENESKREAGETFFYHFQKDSGAESAADDHCMCTGGNGRVQGAGSRD